MLGIAGPPTILVRKRRLELEGNKGGERGGSLRGDRGNERRGRDGSDRWEEWREEEFGSEDRTMRGRGSGG